MKAQGLMGLNKKIQFPVRARAWLKIGKTNLSSHFEGPFELYFDGRVIAYVQVQVRQYVCVQVCGHVSV